jgi:hypothetical protein
VSIGSVVLMELGHDEIWARLLSKLAAMGFEYDKSAVGRADWCVDVPDLSMSEVERVVSHRGVICRSGVERTITKHGKWETYYRGKAGAPLLLRVYDKAAEVKRDEFKQMVMAERRWGRFCKEALRVEFQMRSRPMRRLFNVSSVEQLFADKAVIGNWLCGEWCRLSEPFDRANKNHSRAATVPFWVDVQQRMADWTGDVGGRRRRSRESVPDLEGLEKQVIGCIASKIAQREAVYGDEAAAMEAFDREMEGLRVKYRSQIQERVDKKQQTLIAKARGPAFNDEDIPF